MLMSEKTRSRVIRGCQDFYLYFKGSKQKGDVCRLPTREGEGVGGKKGG